MPFQIVHNDITLMDTDAIVNPANPQLLPGGGVCGAIFRAADSALLKAACEKAAPCPTGQAVITPGYGLRAKYVIHTVGPIWAGGTEHEAERLSEAYRNSMQLAVQNGCNSIAFPLVSAGIYGYPKQEALQIAVGAIRRFLLEHEMDVSLVVFDRRAVTLSEELYRDITHYISTYFDGKEDRRTRPHPALMEAVFAEDGTEEKDRPDILADSERAVNETRMPYRSKLIKPQMPVEEDSSAWGNKSQALRDLIAGKAETFSEMLFRLIDEKGYTDVEVYKRANMDRKLFSKIRSNKDYNPKKQTVCSLAIALRLTLDEAQALLEKAGYSFSGSHKFDIIIRYFLENREYDIFTVNEALFYFEQPLLGA